VSNDPTLYEGTPMVQPPTYNFMKAGMINFTRYLACYYGKAGIRANCISPGGYQNQQPEAFVRRYCERVPLGRMMGHEDLQGAVRSEEHTSELQSRSDLVCRLLLEKKNNKKSNNPRK